jgi:3-oxoacyl-[acyl-carrier protein] reductase
VTLEDKRCLVIGGGGTGIGRAITRALGEAGARVAVADVDERRAREAAAELGERGLPLTVDVRSPSELAAMVEESIDRLGGLDVVVTVVGGQVAFVPAVPLHEIEDDDWDTVYELNLRYVARTLRLVLPRLLEQGTGASIVGGAIATAASSNAGTDGWVEEIPTGRYGTTAEVAAAAVYLASDSSAYMTGQQLVLDGGVSVRGPFPS